MQASESEHRSRVLSVRVGIDFGTAYTKVAIRAADKVFFVTWDGIRGGGAPFLLPGELCIDEGNKYWLGRAPSASAVHSDLKLPFIGEKLASSVQERWAVAFLAWVMRYARAWIYRFQPGLLRNRRLAWEVNLGCPTNAWASHSIHGRYVRLAKLSWLLSQRREGISDETITEVLSGGEIKDEGIGEIGLDGVYLVPEFVAQIAGYVQSPQRRDGLHMLVDIGAGTLDMATFNVYYESRKEEDRFPIFASAVHPMGSHFLMHARLAGLEIGDNVWDDLLATPDRATLERTLGLAPEALLARDVEFCRRARLAVRSLLYYTRQRRYPDAPEWKRGLPVFLAGGGCQCDVYRDAVMGAFQELQVPAHYTPFPRLNSDRHDHKGVDEVFHRLSVAYGLTFDATAGRRILAPHEIEDVPPVQPNRDRPEWDYPWQK